MNRKPGGLADRGRDGEDFDPLGSGCKLGECCEGIPSSPSLVGNEDAVHKLPWPSALYFRRLLVFEGIRGKGADDSDWQEGMDVLS